MYNLLARGIEAELLPFCRKFGLATMVYNPLAGGLLTGKHRPAEPPAGGTRFALKETYRERYWHRRLFDAVEQLRAVAGEANLRMVELALRWLLAQPGVTCLILGASSLAQLEENLAACQGTLPGEVLESCDKVWKELRGPIPRYNR
jgi:aryl-alcohol dehydrogenase-like predicted oxidoreductase